jgi:hypothetical protein
LVGLWSSQQGDAERKQSDPFPRAALALSSDEILRFEALQKLDHPPLRKTSALGEHL